MIIPILALGLIAAVFAQFYDQRQIERYQPQTSHAIYLPPKYKSVPNTNVRRGRDYGSFEDIFDGPSQTYRPPYPQQYPHPHLSGEYRGNIRRGSLPHPHLYVRDLPLSNPFYVERNKQKRRRCHHIDYNIRRHCGGWEYPSGWNYPDTWYDYDR